MLLNNPAARLHQILTLCKKHEKESGVRPMLAGWRKVFRMGESASDFSVMERVGNIYGLPGQISELITRYEDLDQQLYLGWCEELEQAFVNLSFRSEFESFTKHIHRTLLVNLEFCSNALSERCPEPVIEPEQISEMGRLAVEIIHSDEVTDLSEVDQRYFRDYLTLIHRATEDYFFFGAAGLQRTIDACTGTLVTQRNVSLQNRETPIGRKYWGLINKVSKLLEAPETDSSSDHDGNAASVIKPIRRVSAA